MQKRLLSIFLLISIVFSMMTMSASAQALPKKLLVFGDSISTGYGLADKNKSYSELLAKKFGVSKSGYINLAVNGATSADILDVVNNHKKEISAADTVLLTAGGNDLLGVLFSSVRTALGLPADATTEEMQSAFSSNRNAAFLVFLQLLKKDAQTQLSKAGTGISKNILSIAAAVKAANPNAKLYIQTIYNPFSGVTKYMILSVLFDILLNPVNTIIKKDATVGGYNVIDTYSAFKGKASTLTNIGRFDVHPNEAGHKVIYSLIYAAIVGKGSTKPVKTHSYVKALVPAAIS